MTPPEHLTSLSRDALLALVIEQQRQITELTAVMETSRAEIARLTRDAKRPGRRPGAGPFCDRAALCPEQLTEPPVDAPVTHEVCPVCGGRLAQECIDVASTTELPQIPRPKVTQYRVSVSRCTVCGKQVRGQYPDLAPDQYRATAPRVGDRVMAAAHALHYGVGIPVRKVPIVLETLTGVRLTQGASTQDALRRAEDAVGDVYTQWRATVPEQPVVHTDDTSWRVGGEAAYLMAFETDAVTIYQIRPQHRHAEMQEVILADYDGVMVTDRGRSYNAQAFDCVKPQKCLAHILRSLSDVLKTKKGRARDFGERRKTLLTEAMQGWRTYHAGAGADFETTAQRLRDAITHHLRNRCLTDRTINGC